MCYILAPMARILLVALLLLAGGCAWLRSAPTPILPPEELYALGEKELTITADSEMHLSAVRDILESKAIRRNLSLKIFKWEAPQEVGGMRVKQVATLQQGIPDDVAKKLQKLIRDQFPKVQPRIQGDAVKVHPLLVFLAVIAGGEIAGLLGAAFAVPILAVLRVLAGFFAERLRVRPARSNGAAREPSEPVW